MCVFVCVLVLWLARLFTHFKVMLGTSLLVFLWECWQVCMSACVCKIRIFACECVCVSMCVFVRVFVCS